MMSDYERTAELVAAANNSAGASQEQFNKTLDSLESKINQLKDAWDNFTMGIANSDLIKFGTDALTGIVNGVNSLTDVLPGPLNGLSKLGLLIGGIAAGGKIFDKTFKAFKDESSKGNIFTAFGKGIKETTKDFKDFFTQIEKKEKVLDGFEDSLQQARDKVAQGFHGLQKPQASNFFTSDLDDESWARGRVEYSEAVRQYNEQENSLKQENIKLEKIQQTYDAANLKKKTLIVGLTNAQNEIEDANLKALIQQSLVEDKLTKQQFLSLAGDNAETKEKLKQVYLSANQFGIESKIKNNKVLIWLYEKLTNKELAKGLPLSNAQLGLTLGIVAGFAALAIVMGTIAKQAIGLSHNLSIDGKIEAAQEATEGLNSALEKTNEILDKISTYESTFDELTNQLNSLTQGSLAWQEKLLEINETVYNLAEALGIVSQIKIGENGQFYLENNAITQAKQAQLQAKQTQLQAKQQFEVAINSLRLEDKLNEFVSSNIALDSSKASIIDPNTGTFVYDNTENYLSSVESDFIEIITNIDKYQQVLAAETSEDLQKLGINLQGVGTDITQFKNSLQDLSIAYQKAENQQLAYQKQMLSQIGIEGDYADSVARAANKNYNSVYEKYSEFAARSNDGKVGDVTANSRVADFGIGPVSSLLTEYLDVIDPTGTTYRQNGGELQVRNDNGVWEKLDIEWEEVLNTVGIHKAAEEFEVAANEASSNLKRIIDGDYVAASEENKLLEESLGDLQTYAKNNNLNYSELIEKILVGDLDESFDGIDDEIIDNILRAFEEIGYTNFDYTTENTGASARNYLNTQAGTIRGFLDSELSKAESAFLSEQIEEMSLAALNAYRNLFNALPDVAADELYDGLQTIFADFGDKFADENVQLEFVQRIAQLANDGLKKSEIDSVIQEFVDSGDIVANNLDSLTAELYEVTDAIEGFSADDLEKSLTNLKSVYEKLGLDIYEGDKPSFSKADVVEMIAQANGALSEDDFAAVGIDTYILITPLEQVRAALEENTRALLNKRQISIEEETKRVQAAYNLLNSDSELSAGKRGSATWSSYGGLGELVTSGRVAVVDANGGKSSNSKDELSYKDAQTLLVNSGYMAADMLANKTAAEIRDILTEFLPIADNEDALQNEIERVRLEQEDLYQQQYVANDFTRQGIDSKIPEESKDTLEAEALEAQIEAYGGLIIQSEKYSKKLKKVTDDTEDAEKIGRRLALTQNNQEKKLKTLTTVLDENVESLLNANKESIEYMTALENIGESLTSYFGVEKSVFDAEWLLDNQELIQELVSGSEDAFDQIRAFAAQSFANIGSDTTEIAAYISNLDPGFYITSDLDPSGLSAFSEYLTVLGNQAYMTGSQFNALQGIMRAFGGELAYEEAWLVTTPGGAQWISDTPHVGGQSTVQDIMVFKGFDLKQNSPFKTPSLSGGSGGGNKDTEEPNEWVNPYEETYNTLQTIEELIRKCTRAEQEWNRMAILSSTTYEDMQKLMYVRERGLETQISNYTKLMKLQKEAINNIGESGFQDDEGQFTTYEEYWKKIGGKEALFATEKDDIETRKNALTFYDFETGLFNINWNKIQEYEGQDEKFGTFIEELVKALESAIGQYEDYGDSRYEASAELQRLEQESRDARIALIDRLEEALIDKYQEQIDELSELNEIMTDSNQNILDSLQEEIDLSRQIRDNTKTEEDIAQKEARLAFLRRDTSNANALEIKQLEEELAQNREDYNDTLIDQEIQRLSDQSDAESKQRQHQIDIMQEQLDYWKSTDYFSRMAEAMDKDEALRLLEEHEKAQYMTKDELTKFHEEFNELWNKGQSYGSGGAVQSQNPDGSPVPYTLIDANGNKIKDMVYNQQTHQWSNGTYIIPDSKITSVDEDNKTLTTKEVIVMTNSQKKYSIETGKKVLTDILDRNYPNLDTAVRAELIKQIEATLKAYDKKEDGTEDGAISGHYIDQIGRAAYVKLEEYLKKHPEQRSVKKYKTGGLADYTGPAWLDGTKSRPELVLDANDTKNFIQLKNVLASLLNNRDSFSSNSQNNGDNYYNFDITVEEIGSDYDVDRMIDHLKEKIYDDATYRNVNAINLIR